jgi:hypothetical protein
MDKKTKNKWVKALRSGDYQQGQCSLRKILNEGDVNQVTRKEVKERTETFCCLGVLCDIGGGRVSDRSFLTTQFAKKIGISIYMQDKLADMNDGGMTFAKIANYIEKNMDKDEKNNVKAQQNEHD